jgi:hypothetical protein
MSDDRKVSTIIETIGEQTKVITTSTFAAEPEIDPDSQRVSYESGAQRSAAVEHLRYDLIHPLFVKAIAKVMAEGVEKYGLYNWEQGFPISTLFNHLLAHLFNYQSGDRSEDHLGHASCNMMFLVVEAQLRYDQNRDQLRLENCQLSPEMIQAIKDFQQDHKRKEVSKMSSDAISLRLLDLYSSGTIRYFAGAWVPFKQLARLYFNEFSYTNVRKVFADCGIVVNENDQLINFAIKENNAG